MRIKQPRRALPSHHCIRHLARMLLVHIPHRANATFQLHAADIAATRTT
jgi:hypothetical protein